MKYKGAFQKITRLFIRPYTCPFTDLIQSRGLELAEHDRTSFLKRHLGEYSERKLLDKINCKDLEELVKLSLPLLSQHDMLERAPDFKQYSFDKGYSEHFFLSKVIPTVLIMNRDPESYSLFIGQGFYGSVLPEVIKRNVLENPEWYSAYTPYQAEISQGRLQALYLYQQMIRELTGMDVANASLLDEPHAVAEAMNMALMIRQKKKVYVSDSLFNQTRDVLLGRAEALNIELVFGAISCHEFQLKIDETYSCVIIQSPDRYGNVYLKLDEMLNQCRHLNIISIVCADLLSLCIFNPPKEADVVVGSSQRFGMPLGYGGPAAGFIACKMNYIRKLPGRIVGLSIDINGNPGYRLSLQTREQHIRKERAISNICTAQVLPAIISVFYCIYHGPEGLKAIANRIRSYAIRLAKLLASIGYTILNRNINSIFDTIAIHVSDSFDVVQKALENNVLLCAIDKNCILITISEITTPKDVLNLSVFFSKKIKSTVTTTEIISIFNNDLTTENISRSPFLQCKEFLIYHSEQAFTRFLFSLSKKDITLVDNMIPLGSCTMKLNAASILTAFTNPRWNNIHPLTPRALAEGYNFILKDIVSLLSLLTGFSDITFQPASGAQAELTALFMIKKFYKNNPKKYCLIPESAHGTNFASASLAGFKAKKLKCTSSTGAIAMDSFEKSVLECEPDGGIACMMITIPSTFGTEEPNLKVITQRVHDIGGVVYLDGANLNAFLGIVRPVDLGIDMMHINMHKTLAIPHGGGGPGMGPLLVSKKFKMFLPSHPFQALDGVASDLSIKAVSSAPYGSASLLIISWAYLRLLGFYGIRKASQHSLANANYLASLLEMNGYETVFKNQFRFVAHEFVSRPVRCPSSISPVDIAKRLQDYGYHAPTVSWPVSDAFLIEPTECEDIISLEKFATVMKRIAEEIQGGEIDLLKSSPHAQVSSSRILPSSYCVPVGRINEEYGDTMMNLSCCSDVDLK